MKLGNLDLNTIHLGDCVALLKQIKDLKPLVFRKLLENDKLFHGIVLTLFPEKRVLRPLLDYFDGNQKVIYRTIAHNLRSKL